MLCIIFTVIYQNNRQVFVLSHAYCVLIQKEKRSYFTNSNYGLLRINDLEGCTYISYLVGSIY